MTRRLITLALGSLTFASAFSAQAIEYKTVTDNTIVFDAGSTKATPQFILRKNTPVELIVMVGKWVKIREQSGGMGWVDHSLIGEPTQLIVRDEVADIRLSASDSSPIVFQAAKDVLLELMEPPGNNLWIKVRHKDGQTGYILRKSVWGI